MASPLDENNEIFAEGLYDPVFFCRFFLRHLFGGDLRSSSLAPPLPPHQQGLLTVLTGKTEFLWRYKKVSWLMRNFYRSHSKILDENKKPKNLGSIFRIVERESGRELTPAQVAAIENKFSPTILAKKLEIQILTGDIGTVFIVPRGYAKTTTIGIAGSLYIIYYKLYNFIVYISETAPHAEMQCDNVRNEIESNLFFRQIFGDIKPERADAEKWSSKFFETTTGVAFRPRGSGSQVRGLLHKGERPDCVIIDDLEDKNAVKSLTQRKKNLEWVYSDVIPMLPKKKFVPHSIALMLGTLLGRECTIQNIAEDSSWLAVRLANTDIDLAPLWPEAEDLTTIEKEKKNYARQGLLHLYYLEKESRYVPESIQRFKLEHFIFETVDFNKIVSWAIYCDPALGKSRTSDRSVIQVGGMMEDGRIYMAAEWSIRYDPDAVKTTILNYFRLAKLFSPAFHGFEANAYQAAIGNLLTDSMPRENYYFEPEPIINYKKKNERIGGTLLPRVASGFLIWHPSFKNSETIDEALEWNPEETDQPDDGIDCATGVVSLLEPLHMYASSTDPMIDDEEEYPPLELVFGRDWRDAP